MLLPLLFGLIAFSAVCHGHTCPEDNSSVPIVEVGENCTTYYYCDGPELKTASCPEEEAFDILFQACRNASDVFCFESSHHKQKRSNLQIHSISIQSLKTSIKKLEKALMSSIETTLEEIAPSILSEIQKKYVPFVLNIKEEVMPIVKKKLLPQIKTSVSYVKKLALKTADKIHHSIELSNSTHINIVSFSDIMSDISKDAEPFLRLAKFFSTKALHGARIKRQVNPRQQDISLAETFLKYLDPLVAQFIPSIRKMIISKEYTFRNKVILPIVFDMLQDRETRQDLARVFFIAKNSFGPFAINTLVQQLLSTPRAAVFPVSREQVVTAKTKFTSEAEPLIDRISEKYFPRFLDLCSKNVSLITEEIEKLKESSTQYIPELKLRIRNFIVKHGSVFLTSNSTHINTYSFMEIKTDFKKIERIVLEILVDKVSKERSSFLSSIFNRNSIFYSVLTAGEPQIIPEKFYTGPVAPEFKKYFSNFPQEQNDLNDINLS